ncbi:hypothetical protein FisN_13Hh294 [Fistulifera solaris]|uniref:GP-PDE domain-containing protein n=1 Tax=Fistulifera solaris TaxID=1519565 RepID=A0A1Z5KN78_FISSO|nr:hypothetical protein FisN_13Hh294 [Fistulifera solaris]|eukprot:GAX27617.1 hypothetical protein FisN_13Hh294 [Fistulifera solaris]
MADISFHGPITLILDCFSSSHQKPFYRMVNFGGHSKAVRASLNAGNAEQLYLVHYNDLKAFLFQAHDDDIAVKRIEFSKQWQDALREASLDLQEALQEVWQRVFVATHDMAAARGAPPGTALQHYLDIAGSAAATELRTRMTVLHTAASTNFESLRKLVKKFDKHHPDAALSTTLLPILYASHVFSCQAMLEGSIQLMRTLIHQTADDDDAEDEPHFLPLSRMDSEAGHDIQVESRMHELDWLRRLVSTIPASKIGRLVAHRGFHHIQDRNDKRPLENSLAAYELAWTSGIHLCECDVALTKDEKLVLAHDEDFQRLALDSKSEYSSRRVQDLTFKELISLPLKSGLRCPLLIDVLRSAHAISETSKLIIEIKPGNCEAASALARLLWRHPELCSCVEMVMSFDAYTMHRLRAEFTAYQVAESIHVPTHRSTMSFQSTVTYDHFGTMTPPYAFTPRCSSPNASPPQLPPRPPSHSHHHSLSFGNLDYAAVGLSLSHTNLSHLTLPDAHPDENGAFSEPSNPQQPPRRLRTIPKLMLLTVASEPKKPCELCVSVEDLSPIAGWLQSDHGSLDGVYLQFQKEMKTTAGASALHDLSQRYAVGVWGYSGKDPDDWETFHWLVEQGNVSYVNSDLPGNFRKEIVKARSSIR